MYFLNKSCAVVPPLGLWYMNQNILKAGQIAIAQKEINETLYWLELLSKTEYITPKEYDSIRTDATEVIKLLTSILKTIKKQQQ